MASCGLTLKAEGFGVLGLVAAGLPGSAAPYMTNQSVQRWIRRQPLNVVSAHVMRLKCFRRTLHTCDWQPLSTTANCGFASVSTERAVFSRRVYPRAVFPYYLRCFGTQRVVQKRRHQMRILHPLQTPYIHHAEGTRPPPIPHSLTATGTIKRLLNCNSAAAKEAASRINWQAYISHKKGVRWHPQGAWRVQFTRRNYERNFFVRCECYFKVSDYGFQTAKELAVRYRDRLEKEWEELQQQWTRLDIQEARARLHSKTGVAVGTHRPPSLGAVTVDGGPDANTSSTEKVS